MKNILVTGATGFIGQVLVKHLLAKQCHVRVLVRDVAKAQFLSKQVEVFTGTLEQPESLVGLCRGIDTVFHLAGHAHAWAEKDAEASRKHQAVNFQGTENVVKESLRSGVSSFVYFSTVKAVADSTQVIDENAETLPDTAYGIAKRNAEQLVLQAGKDNAMQVSILRPTLVYGLNLKGNLASMLKAIDKGYFLPLPEMNNIRSMIGLNDLCRAAILVAENSHANGKIYIVSDNVNYSSRELYNLMRQALGKTIPGWQVPYSLLKLMAVFGDVVGKHLQRRLPFDSQALAKLLGSAHYSSRRIQDELGFMPQESFAQVLPEIIACYRNTKK